MSQEARSYMRILLMMAPTCEKQHSIHAAANHPLALAQLAAQLDKKHEIKGYDPDMDPGYPKSMVQLIASFKPDLIGINFRIFDTTLSYEPRSYLPELEKALTLTRKAAPLAVIVIGGSAYSFFPDILLERLPQVDLGFLLDADVSFPAFVENPSDKPVQKGIYYRDNDKIIYTGKVPETSFDSFASPDFDLIPMAPYARQGRAAIGLEGKRGCKLKCIPCVYPFLTGSKIMEKSPKKIVDEVEQLAMRGVKSFFFLDSIFNLPARHGIEVCEALSKAKLPVHWGAFLSAGRFDDEIARLYYEAGCRLYYFAPDGISGQSIKTWKRPITMEGQKKAIEIVRKRRDNHLHVSFLVGSPGESWHDLLEFAKVLFFLALNRVFSISMSFTRIYPKTGLWEIAVSEGVITREDNLLEPKFYRPFPSSLTRFLFHPAYKFMHVAARVVRWFSDAIFRLRGKI